MFAVIFGVTPATTGGGQEIRVWAGAGTLVVTAIGIVCGMDENSRCTVDCGVDRGLGWRGLSPGWRKTRAAFGDAEGLVTLVQRSRRAMARPLRAEVRSEE